MASSKVMATSRNSDLKRKLSTHASSSSGTDFRRVDNSGNARDSVVSDLRNSFVERRNSSGSDQGHGSVESNSGALLNAEIKLIDTVGSTDTISDGEMERPVVVKKTVDDVWREIVEGKKSEQKPKQEMMTLEDFLAKAGAVEEEEKMGKGAIVEVKRETTLSGGIHTYGSCSGVIGMGLGVGMDVEGLGRGRGKRSMSLLEPLDKAAQQRQRRMIKNRESAARSRERKQAYQVELESMAVRLEEENERLLEEKAERSKKRLKQLMENVIPVVEKRRPSLPRLRRIRSM